MRWKKFTYVHATKSVHEWACHELLLQRAAGRGWRGVKNGANTVHTHLQSYIIVGTSYYCRIDGWFMWSNIQHREWNWAWKWILVSQFAAETDIDMGAIVI